MPDPGQVSLEPGMLAVSARGLATQIAICRRLVLEPLSRHPMDTEGDALYPVPHSPIFDFEATAHGADWIDLLAREARTARDQYHAPPVVAHCDWSLRNVRLTASDLIAVYDWDSLANTREVVAVGQAAATWSAIDGSRIAPDVEEVARYVRDYEAARGSAFSAEEHAAIGAAALYALAYTARCEHTIDPNGDVHRRARPRLEADGDHLLRLPDVMTTS